MGGAQLIENGIKLVFSPTFSTEGIFFNVIGFIIDEFSDFSHYAFLRFMFHILIGTGICYGMVVREIRHSTFIGLYGFVWNKLNFATDEIEKTIYKWIMIIGTTIAYAYFPVRISY